MPLTKTSLLSLYYFFCMQYVFVAYFPCGLGLVTINFYFFIVLFEFIQKKILKTRMCISFQETLVEIWASEKGTEGKPIMSGYQASYHQRKAVSPTLKFWETVKNALQLPQTESIWEFVYLTLLVSLVQRCFQRFNIPTLLDCPALVQYVPTTRKTITTTTNPQSVSDICSKHLEEMLGVRYSQHLLHLPTVRISFC